MDSPAVRATSCELTNDHDVFMMMIDGDDGVSAGELVMTLMIKIVTQATEYDDVVVRDVDIMMLTILTTSMIIILTMMISKSTQETRGEV